MVEGSTPRAAAALRTEPHWSMACWIAANSTRSTVTFSGRISRMPTGGGFPVLRPEFLGKIFPPNLISRSGDHQVLQHIFQLPDVTRPDSFQKRRWCRRKSSSGCDTSDSPPSESGLSSGTMSSFRSRRGGIWTPDHIQTVVQILPELSLPNHLLQILVGGRDDPDVDIDGLGAPTRVTFRCWSTRSASPACAAEDRRSHPERPCRRSPPRRGPCVPCCPPR